MCRYGRVLGAVSPTSYLVILDHADWAMRSSPSVRIRISKVIAETPVTASLFCNPRVTTPNQAKPREPGEPHADPTHRDHYPTWWTVSAATR